MLASPFNFLFCCFCPQVGFAAPEVLVDRIYGPAADVFSAGCLLHLLLLGYPAIPGVSAREIIRNTIRGEVHVILFNPLNFVLQVWGDVLVMLFLSFSPLSTAAAAASLGNSSGILNLIG